MPKRKSYRLTTDDGEIVKVNWLESTGTMTVQANDNIVKLSPRQTALLTAFMLRLASFDMVAGANMAASFDALDWPDGDAYDLDEAA